MALCLHIPSLSIAGDSEVVECYRSVRVLVAEDLLPNGPRLTVVALGLSIPALGRAVDSEVVE